MDFQKCSPTKNVAIRTRFVIATFTLNADDWFAGGYSYWRQSLFRYY